VAGAAGTAAVAASAAGMAHAQGEPARKAAAASSAINQAIAAAGSSGPNPPFFTALSTSIRAPGGKGLFITFSAQTLLLTNSLNVNIAAPVGASFILENVGIQVRALLDANPISVAPASPPVTVVTLDNLIRSTAWVNIAVPAVTVDILNLVLSTGGAHSFTWIAPNVGVGVHTVAIEARFLCANATAGIAASVIAAVLGPRTLTIEEVKL